MTYRPTISIRMLLAVVAFIALACTSLAWANGIWATTLFTAALGVLLFAMLAAVLRRQQKQAFWIGFAIFGWGYLWLAHWPNGDFPYNAVAFGGTQRQWTLQSGQEDSLATTRLLAHAYLNWLPKIRPLPSAPATPPAYTAYSTGTAAGTYVVTGSGTPGAPADPSSPPVYSPPSTTTYAYAVPVTTPTTSYPAMHEFTRVGHSFFTIIFALVGGCLGTVLYRTRDAKEKPPASAGG
jgi:hypothetical protein